MVSRQPLLHDLLVTLAAPTQAWSGRDGQIRGTGAEGVFHSDVRVLRSAVLTVDDEEPEVVAAGSTPDGAVEAIALARGIDGPGADPTVRLRRTRRATPGRVDERIELTSALGADVTARLRLEVAGDLATMEAVKSGRTGPLLAPEHRDGGLHWSDGVVSAVLTGEGALVGPGDQGASLTWDVVVPARGAVAVTWSLAADDAGAVVGPATVAAWSDVTVHADDPRLGALVDQSLADLRGLLMTRTGTPQDTFLAAGSPWFFTLFGRDSIIAARMLLPLGTELAGGTLRTLAALQGRTSDPMTAEQPGKIMHELRRAPLTLAEEGVELPALYYGTVDATPLWVCLLHDAWRWGLPDDEVRDLLPHLEAALAWMAEHGDADGDGFLEYVDESGRGLANQGWKDSGDSIQFRDGRLADGPIALAEVQGYAYEAAMSGAALLDAFGRPGADRWRAWAGALATRFREAFWLTDEIGPYPAIALDRDKTRVDVVASNMGHLLGTGILDDEESTAVARRLVHPELSSGFGLRTMATSSAGYWPLKYHGGSVWTHDTGLAVLGLSRAGFGEEAGVLVSGLLAAADDFGYRMPELYGGDAADDVASAVAYPAACRPQAWSAATSVALLTALLGLSPDGDRLEVAPLAPSPVGALHVDGLRFRGRSVALRADAGGRVADAADAATNR
ncbi:amylo-alpha-1,6-glucosidase [Cellulomonas sp. DKR-3]|uniref:Amylo-alpha-1,6-glucosidase n=1 Tax=Cellulomonas fulva TaxID=2835530 RepID=A0ABS5TV52_9CELL|nr:glycogen debranching N-terminal domain-containing protein [Cellulomonas fulva]MBT0992983.1 amylo-alpha-1,6-glucosidase [Cellulomonas fulva]